MDGHIVTNGFETLEELINKYGELPDTVLQKSGSGEGNHYLFNHVEGIKNDVGFLPSLDIRGDGGYVIVSPSIHPDSGRKYEWDPGFHPTETKIADAPDWLIHIIQKPKHEQVQAKPSKHWGDIFHNTVDGTRNKNAASLIGHLYRRGVDPSLIYEMAHLWNREQVDPPLEEWRINRTLESIAKAELKRRQGYSGKGGITLQW